MRSGWRKFLTTAVAALAALATLTGAHAAAGADKPIAAAQLGAEDFLPTPDHPVGYRGDWTGRYPGAAPLTQWSPAGNLLWKVHFSDATALARGPSRTSWKSFAPLSPSTPSTVTTARTAASTSSLLCRMPCPMRPSATGPWS